MSGDRGWSRYTRKYEDGHEKVCERCDTALCTNESHSIDECVRTLADRVAWLAEKVAYLEGKLLEPRER